MSSHFIRLYIVIRNGLQFGCRHGGQEAETVEINIADKTDRMRGHLDKIGISKAV